MQSTAPTIVGGLAAVLAVSAAVTLRELLASAASDPSGPATAPASWYDDDAATGFLRGTRRLATLVVAGATLQAASYVWQAIDS